MSEHPETLTFTATQIDRLRDHLIQDDELERIAVAFCSESGDDTLLIEEFRLLADDQHEVQKPAACRLNLDVEYNLMKECRDRRMHPAIIHSHPFDSVPGFSRTDNDLMPELQRFVNGLYPEATVMFAVLGDRGMDTAIYNPEADRFDTVPVNVIGDWTLDPPVTTPVNEYTETVKIDWERTDRSVRAFTEEGQRMLAATHVGLIGAGGLGSIMAEHFARSGIGEITVVDPDTVERSNLNRLFGGYDYHIGRPKVDALEELLYKDNPSIEVTAIQAPAEDVADALKQCDLLVAGVDQMSARMWLNQFAVRHLIPYVDAGVVIETTGEADHSDDSSPQRVESLEGYIQFIVPGVTACFSCLDRHDPEITRLERLDDDELQDELERGYIDESDLSPEPAVAPLNGVVASKTALLVSKWATGYAPPEHWLRFEDIGNVLTTFPTTPSDACATCGDTGFLGRGDREATADELDTAGLDLTADFNPNGSDPSTAATNPSDDDRTTKETVAAFFEKLHPV